MNTHNPWPGSYCAPRVGGHRTREDERYRGPWHAMPARNWRRGPWCTWARHVVTRDDTLIVLEGVTGCRGPGLQFL